jgi:hypothetical protein
MVALSVAACLRRARADFEATAAIIARMLDACTAAVAAAAVQATPFTYRSAETAVAPHPRGSKRPSDAAAAGAAPRQLSSVPPGRQNALSQYIGVSWSQDHGQWYAWSDT